MSPASAIQKLIELKQFTLAPSDLFTLVQAIPEKYKIIAPKAEGYALNYGIIDNPLQIALGYISHEEPGSYRLYKDEGSVSLDKARTMNNLKWFTERPDERIYTAEGKNGSFIVEEPEYKPRPQAFVFVRPCDVNAIYCMDRTFNHQYRDPMYDRFRDDNLIIAINCFHPGKNCFCATFNAGPTLRKGFDLLLSDLGGEYLIEIGTEKGARLITEIPLKQAAPNSLGKKDNMTDRAKRSMPKAFNIKNGAKALAENYNHPYWEQITDRCFSCANCVMVCPLCFCYRTVEETDVKQTQTKKTRKWDACQSPDFAQVAGHNFREERIQRLKHWCNHKIRWQYEQMGCSGCVGCGRCITWCPTGIDITEPVWHMGGKGVGL
jgi:ferredoxin